MGKATADNEDVRYLWYKVQDRGFYYIVVCINNNCRFYKGDSSNAVNYFYT